MEVLCAKVTVSKDNYFLLVVSYIPPEKKEKLEGLLKVLDNCKDYKHIFLTGDLNSKSLEWNNKKVNPCGTILEEYMHNNGLLCINDGLPTRRTSDSVIDLFIVSPKVIPEVVFCETMACENIRSDHIGVLLEVYQKVELNSVTSEKYLISKANWDIWRNCTEEKYKAWNEANLQYDSIDDMTEAFMDIYTKCMVEAVPRIELKSQNRRKKTPWWKC